MEEQIAIWGKDIPYNTGEDKLSLMDIHPEYNFIDMFIRHPGIFSKKEDIDDFSGNETNIYKEEIQKGPAKPTFDDEPFLIPYLKEGSDRAMIIVPGGGYLTKSMDNEGREIAGIFHAAGISSFVLWYRSYPYLHPVPCLDLQRAVRYVRHHADAYGIDRNKVGIIGFSAGGNCCGNLVNILRNKPVEYEGYEQDEVDAEDAMPALAGLIYPALDLERQKVFTAVLIGKDAYRDKTQRDRMATLLTQKTQIRSDSPPQFLCHAKNDSLVNWQCSQDYYDALLEKGVIARLVLLKAGGHGFGSCMQKGIFGLLAKRAREWLPAFTSWANGLFDAMP